MSPAMIGVTSPATTATHHFVEPRDALREVPDSNHRAPTPGARKRRQVSIAEPASDLGRPRERGLACSGIA